MSTPTRAIHRWGRSVLLAYGLVGIIFGSIGVWLVADLTTSRSNILAERAALALQTSKFMCQWFGTTLLSADYVLRDVTTRVGPAELDRAGTGAVERERLSAMLDAKLKTLPGVEGLGVVDRRGVFVAAADPRLIGHPSHSRIKEDAGRLLDDRLYVEYVPAQRSANGLPALLVSRPLPSADGSFQGGALASVLLRTAQEWLEAFPVHRYDSLAMVDGEGALLARNPPRPSAIGGKLHDLSAQPRFGNSGGSATFTNTSPNDGRERIYGISRVESIPISIIVGFDKAQALAEWRHRSWQLVAGYLTMVFLTVLTLRNHLDTLAQRDEMKRLAITDPLTGVANRRQLTQTGAIEVKKALRNRYPLSLLMVDIDHFKAINDTWGHPTGDRVIQILARAMGASVRDTDVVGRLGGEEFLAILPGTGPEGAGVLANRLRVQVEKGLTAPSDEGVPVHFTISIGVAGLEEGSSFDELLIQVDKALYQAKAAGRNRVRVDPGGSAGA